MWISRPRWSPPCPSQTGDTSKQQLGTTGLELGGPTQPTYSRVRTPRGPHRQEKESFESEDRSGGYHAPNTGSAAARFRKEKPHAPLSLSPTACPEDSIPSLTVSAPPDPSPTADTVLSLLIWYNSPLFYFSLPSECPDLFLHCFTTRQPYFSNLSVFPPSQHPSLLTSLLPFLSFMPFLLRVITSTLTLGDFSVTVPSMLPPCFSVSRHR